MKGTFMNLLYPSWMFALLIKNPQQFNMNLFTVQIPVVQFCVRFADKIVQLSFYILLSFKKWWFFLLNSKLRSEK